MDEISVRSKTWFNYQMLSDSPLDLARANMASFINREPRQIFSTTKKAKKFLEEIGIDETDYSAVLDALKYIDFMPLSGKFSLRQNNDDILLKMGNFPDEDLQEFLSQDNQLLFDITQFRNSEEDINDEFQIGDNVILFAALRFLNLSSQHLRNGLFPKERKRKLFGKPQIMSLKLEKNLIRLIMAIESLKVSAIAEAMAGCLNEFKYGLMAVEDLLKNIAKNDNAKDRILEELNQLIEHSNASYDLFTSICSDPALANNRFPSNCITISKLFTSIEKTVIGKTLTKNLKPSLNLLKDTGLTLDTDIENLEQKKVHANNISRTLLLEEFILEREFQQNDLVTTNSIAEEQHAIPSLSTLIYSEMIGYLHEYKDVKENFDHFDSSFGGGDDIFTRQLKDLSSIINWLSSPTPTPNYDCLLSSPADFKSAYKSIFNNADADVKFNEQIRLWTRHLEYDPNNQNDGKPIGTSLLQLIDGQNGGSEWLTLVHERLQPTMNPMDNAAQTFARRINELASIKNQPAGANSVEHLEKLRDSRQELHNAYRSHITELAGEFTEVKFEKFAEKITNDIISYHTQIVGDQFYIAESSGTPKTMMIGLGQAGQQIVRAAVARMLNTLTDVRSQNMLKGLGLDLDEVKKLADSPGGLDKVADKKTEGQYFETFNRANILAVNAGEELRKMLGAPYNYIWGKSDDSVAKKQTRNCLRPANNLALLDKKGEGSGNRMGKGRAFAVLAEDGLIDAIKDKEGNQTITQVCIVHSFSGGSGSGMILPFLSIIKNQFPNALIWVFSAGAEYDAPDPYRHHNTTYITSDILQAHYDALHHRESKITKSDWDHFRISYIKNTLGTLNNIWENELKEYMPFSEVSLELDEFLSDDEIELWNGIGTHPPLTEGDRQITHENHHSIVEECLPQTPEDASAFVDSATDPVKSNQVQTWWKKWHEMAQDIGGRSLQHYAAQSNNIRQAVDAQKMRTRYNISYSRVMAIAQGVYRLYDKGFEEAMASLVADKVDEEFRVYMELGIRLNVDPKINDLEEIKRSIEKYASLLRDYYHKIEEMGENILLMIGMREDTKIKHVILSNSHLDRAASFYKGRESPYEIYNSVMIDVFINLIHGLVEEVDYTNTQELEESASSFEFMDTSDLRTVTAPPIHATMVDFSNTYEVNNSQGYDEALDSQVISADPVYKIFQLLFTSGNSPLYNSTIEGDQRDGDEFSMQSLYHNFLSNTGGIRNYSPSDVIDGFSADDLIFKSHDLENFLEEIVSTPRLSAHWQVAKTSNNFSNDELLNMCNWLSLIPVEKLSWIYPEEWRNDFIGRCTELQKKYHNLTTSENPSSIFNPDTRENRLMNHITTLLPNVSNKAKQEMGTLLNEMGILSPQHLAAVPSGVFYEFAPNLLTPSNLERKLRLMKINKGKGGDVSLKQLIEQEVIENFPAPSRNLARMSVNWPGKREFITAANGFWNGENAFSMTPAQDGEPMPYLRIPSIPRRPIGNAPKVPYLEVNSSFMKDFATLKIKTGELYPEFSSLALIDKLVNAASNNRLHDNRHISEIPILRRATTDLKVYSYPRRLYPAETSISAFLRLVLLGDLSMGDDNPGRRKITEKLYDELSDKVPNYSTMVKGIQAHEFNPESFNMNQFSNQLHRRFELLLHPEFIANLDYTSKGIILTIQEHVSELLEHEKGPIEIFNKLANLFADGNAMVQESNEKLEGLSRDIETQAEDRTIDADTKINENSSPNVDKFSLEKSIVSLHKLFSRLTDLLFLAKRQYEFLQGRAKAGQGVAFNFEGTIDSVRSSPTRYLALINNASDINPRLVKSAVNQYFTAFVDGGRSEAPPNGKVYLQRIKSGPIANFTLLQQQAAIVEIAEGFVGLMNKLEREKFKVITSPLVHPYSFLRNILWLSTMKDKWLDNPTEAYRDQLSIPPGVVDSIFSKPEVIDGLTQTVRTDPDMSGFTFSQQDEALWDNIMVCGEEINEENKRLRYRTPLQIPDLLLIKSWQARITSPKTLDDIMSDPIHADILKIYPATNWKEKFEQKGLTTELFYPIESATGEKVLDEPDFGFGDDFGDLDEDETSDSEIREPWFEALKEWMDYIKQPVDPDLESEGQ